MAFVSLLALLGCVTPGSHRPGSTAEDQGAGGPPQKKARRQPALRGSARASVSVSH